MSVCSVLWIRAGYFVSARFFNAGVCFRERERVCVNGGRDDRGGPGGMEPPVADSTPFSFYYEITCDKQPRRWAEVRPAGEEL